MVIFLEMIVFLHLDVIFTGFKIFLREQMADPACLTCTKEVPGQDQAVSVGNRQEVQTALSKHFWFSVSISGFVIVSAGRLLFF